MTLFEYIAIAFSLIFSYAAMRLVAVLPYAVATDKRDWLHLSHVLLILFGIVKEGGLRDQETQKKNVAPRPLTLASTTSTPSRS